MKKHKCLILTSLILISLHLSAQDTASVRQRENPVSFEVSYSGDLMGNVAGGIKQGGTYLGYAQLGLLLDFEKMGAWKGGVLCIKGGNTHSGTPSETFIGDFQSADNIEAGNHTFLQELWFSQTIWQFELKAGLQDFNADFTACESAALFVNSSFGIHAVLSDHTTLPIFPIMGLGANLRWNFRNDMSWIVGAYDCPYDFEENPYNVHWKFTKEKGGILATEYQYTPTIKNELQGQYQVGFTYETAGRNWGVYLNASQAVWKRNQKTLNLFVMSALERHLSEHMYFQISGGASMTGVFSKKGKDVLGIACTSAMSSNKLEHETAIELTYQYQIHEFIYLQPDIQYIINPSGTEEELDNALMLLLRLKIEFNR